jgi:SAM-dependent methyltransferase
MNSEGYSKPFTLIGPYYDKLMSFVNYPSWISYIEKILSLNAIREKRIFDLACGTGVCLELWLKKGYEVIGLDASAAMLETCRKRLAQYPNFRLIRGDMRDFRLDAAVPAITCLYDSCNYMLEPDDLYRCFKCSHEALAPGGIYVFDMNTQHALEDEWGNQTFTRKDDSVYSTWSNTFDKQKRISSLKLTLTVYEDGREITFREFHQERAYTLAEISTALSRAGFTFSLYRHLTFNPASERDTRIMGVALKW